MTQVPPPKVITLYTAGVCPESPGPGGWGCILSYGKHQKELSGFMSTTTPERMELLALISGLGALKEKCLVRLCTRSEGLIQAVISSQAGGLGLAFGAANASGQGDSSLNDLLPILGLQLRKHKVECYQVKGLLANQPCLSKCVDMATAAIGDYRRKNGLDQEQT